MTLKTKEEVILLSSMECKLPPFLIFLKVAGTKDNQEDRELIKIGQNVDSVYKNAGTNGGHKITSPNRCVLVEKSNLPDTGWFMKFNGIFTFMLGLNSFEISSFSIKSNAKFCKICLLTNECTVYKTEPKLKTKQNVM